MRMFRALGLAAVLALAGCATVSGPSAQQMSQAQQAQKLAAQGQYEQAAQAYTQLAAQGGGADYFNLRAAQAWQQAGRMDKVAALLQSIHPGHLKSRDRTAYRLLQADVDLHQGHSAQALSLTTGMSADQLPMAQRLRLLELRARAQAAQQQPFAAARTRVRMDPMLSGPDQAANRRQIAKLLTGMGPAALQQQASGLAQGSPMHHWVDAALNQLGVSTGQPAPALNTPVGTSLIGQASEQGYQAPGKVALLLPRSGPLKAAAQVIREGVFAGYMHHQDNGQAGSSSLVTYDSGTSPAQAEAAYQKAVAAGAQLVVGPLARKSVAAITGQGHLPVPLLALNHADRQQLPPDNVTEFGLQPETEGAQVADYMINAGITQAVVLISSEDFAQRAGDAFKAQFIADGGTVVTENTLNPAQVNYNDQISAIDWAPLLPDTAPANGQDGSGKKAQGQSKSKAQMVSPLKLLAQGKIDSGIFISMRPEQARLLMPQLRLAQVDLPVFATSHIYAGRNDPDDDGDLDGVTFCDAPWLFDTQPGLPSRARIGRSLSAVQSGTGARLFAMGMDAWALTPYLSWLRSHPGSYLPGATGRLTEDDFGHLHRVLIWARFHHGIARPLDGSLEAGPPSQPPAGNDTGNGNPARSPAASAAGNGG